MPGHVGSAVGLPGAGAGIAERARAAIRGSVRVSRGGSRLLARALARRSVLVGGRGTKLSETGRQTRRSLGARRASFVVKLSALARGALRRRGRLTISLRVTVTPKLGKAYAATRSVLLRRATGR